MHTSSFVGTLTKSFFVNFFYKLLIKFERMSKFPKVLTSTLGEDALPSFYQVELKKHFELVPEDEYEKCPEKYDKGS